jgi:4-amino-4-deoxy-L-arabinose transferase-like glycosyltransferase
MSVRRSQARALPALVFLGAFLLVAVTIPHYGLAWDEPWYFYAADLKVAWLSGLGRELLSGRVGDFLRDDVIAEAWHWDPSHVPHPPFSRILSGLSRALFGSAVDAFTAYRLPSALFLAAVAAGMYAWAAAVFDRPTAVFAAAAVLVMPNLFGQAHFAMTDMPLAALWFLVTLAFWKGLSSARWSVACGVLWGLALATKFPAFAIPVALIPWAHWFRRASYANNAFALMFLGPSVMVASNPYLWHQGPARIAQFVHDSLSRTARPGTDFAVFFLNEHHRSATLPWYYAPAMTAWTVPEPLLALSALGALSALWPGARPEHREVVALFALSAALVLAMGLAPGAPLHDVNRLMLPALPFLAGLAGAGFFALTRALVARAQRRDWGRRIGGLRPKVIGVALVLTLLSPVADLVAHHPYELSYFNRLVGGVRGAYDRGLEVTYLMEAFNPRFLGFLDRELSPGSALNASFGNFMFVYYQRHGRLRGDVRITDGTDFDLYVLLNRPSAFDEDRVFLATRPVVRDLWCLRGAPLILIYGKRAAGAQPAVACDGVHQGPGRKLRQGRDGT